MMSPSSGTFLTWPTTLGERHPPDVRAVEPDHGAERTVGDRAHRGSAESEREQPVVGRGRAAALQVPQHERAGLLAGTELDGPRHLAGDPSEPIYRADPAALDQLDVAAAGPGTLGHHHDAEAPARRFPRADLRAHLLDVEGDLGDQDHVGAAREAAVQGDPAGVAAHQLHHHDPVVTLRRGVHLVQRLRRGAHGAVEAEGALGAAHVVVDRLRYADYRKPFAPELVGDLKAAVPADGDEGVEAAGLEGGHQIVRPVDLHLVAVLVPADVAEGIAAVGGAEDGAAQVGDAANFGRAQRNDAVEGEQALVASLDAVGPPATMMGGQHDGADDRVEARCVAPTGGDRNPHRLFPRPRLRLWRRPPTAPGPDQSHDFSRLRVTTQRPLGEEQLTIDLDLEHAARRRDEPDVGVRPGLLQLGRQPGGPGLIVSADAILDRHPHRHSPPEDRRES